MPFMTATAEALILELSRLLDTHLHDGLSLRRAASRAYRGCHPNRGCLQPCAIGVSMRILITSQEALTRMIAAAAQFVSFYSAVRMQSLEPSAEKKLHSRKSFSNERL